MAKTERPRDEHSDLIQMQEAEKARVAAIHAAAKTHDPRTPDDLVALAVVRGLEPEEAAALFDEFATTGRCQFQECTWG